MTLRKASSALMPLAEALDRLLGGLAPVAPRALLLDAARGAVSAGAVAAPEKSGRTVALRDGWAVAAAAVTGASPYAPVLLGREPAWIEAGDSLPAGTDTVLVPEAVEGRSVVGDAFSGEGTRGPGEEFSPHDDPLVAAGGRVTPLGLLALGAAGLDRVEVRVLALRLVATHRAGRFAPALAAFASARGAAVETVAAGSEDAVAGAIRDGAADAVLVLGGTGLGRTDRSAAALGRVGTVAAHGIALRPGETAAFGAAAGRPVLLLPGRPDAMLAAFLTLGRPLIAALAGAAPPPRAHGTLRRKLASTIGLSEIVFVRRTPEGIEPLGGADIPVGRLIRADGAVLVPPDSEGYPTGATVEVIPL